MPLLLNESFFLLKYSQISRRSPPQPSLHQWRVTLQTGIYFASFINDENCFQSWTPFFFFFLGLFEACGSVLVSVSPVEGTVDIHEGQVCIWCVSVTHPSPVIKNTAAFDWLCGCLMTPHLNTGCSLHLWEDRHGKKKKKASDLQLLSTFPADWEVSIPQLDSKSGPCRDWEACEWDVYHRPV